MSIQEELLDQVRIDISKAFSNHKYFLVRQKHSAKEECDHIYLKPKVHHFLAKKHVNINNEDYVFGAIQRDKDKIRLRFYKRNVENYLKLTSLFEKLKLKSSFFNPKDSNEGYCFDYTIGSNPSKRELILQDVELFFSYFEKGVTKKTES
ncbi:hypothetical protein [Neobacillus drentensis]|uniref:hypothetical protein n=1 Tax=Neobacillus drentensis TaxID=220684 RepID=UPI0030007463